MMTWSEEEPICYHMKQHAQPHDPHPPTVVKNAYRSVLDAAMVPDCSRSTPCAAHEGSSRGVRGTKYRRAEKAARLKVLIL